MSTKSTRIGLTCHNCEPIFLIVMESKSTLSLLQILLLVSFWPFTDTDLILSVNNEQHNYLCMKTREMKNDNNNNNNNIITFHTISLYYNAHHYTAQFLFHQSPTRHMNTRWLGSETWNLMSNCRQIGDWVGNGSVTMLSAVVNSDYSSLYSHHVPRKWLMEVCCVVYADFG